MAKSGCGKSMSGKAAKSPASPPVKAVKTVTTGKKVGPAMKKGSKGK